MFLLKKFDDLLDGEKILYIKRRHRFVYITRIMKTILLFIVVGAIAGIPFFYSHQLIAIMGKDAFYGGSTLLILAVIVMFTLRLWSLYIDWEYDNLIVTNQRVIQIDQHFLFGRDTQAIHLKDIVNMTCSHSGVIASVFGYGSIVVQTSSAIEDDCMIHFMPDPGDIVKIIHNQQVCLHNGQTSVVQTPENIEVPDSTRQNLERLFTPQ